MLFILWSKPRLWSRTLTYVAQRTHNATKPMHKMSRKISAIVVNKISVGSWSVIAEYLAMVKPLKIATKRLEANGSLKFTQVLQ